MSGRPCISFDVDDANLAEVFLHEPADVVAGATADKGVGSAESDNSVVMDPIARPAEEPRYAVDFATLRSREFDKVTRDQGVDAG